MILNSKIKIGTRASKLAICQAIEVKNAILHSHPEYSENDIEIIKITTSGDILLDQKISVIGDKSLFTKEIEEELLKKNIDIAVHSMKDLPAILPKGLSIKAVLKREDPSDAFISNKYNSLSKLPQGATIATSSIRRKSMLLNYRSDLNIIDIRGSIHTRLEKLEKLNIDGIILAASGLKRVNKANHITQILPFNIMLPAIGQGALGVECRENDLETIRILSAINNQETESCTNAERNFMLHIGGGCNTPIACYAYIKEQIIYIKAKILAPSGKQVFSINRSGQINKSDDISKEMANTIKKEARNILNLINPSL